MEFSNLDKNSNSNDYWMQYAINLAKKGYWTTKPNPSVGCVIVSKNKNIAEGYHQLAGKEHAEIEAINDFKSKQLACSSKDLIVYVTLEPCCHEGKTPPCTEALISLKPDKVVVGMLDPNPLVSGKGIASLKNSGIKVETIANNKLLAQLADLNQAYIFRMQFGRPQVVLKVATSLDGRTTDIKGNSKWITNEQSRQDGHKLRLKSDIVLCGINTLAIDNARYTARLSNQWLANSFMSDSGDLTESAKVLARLQPKVAILDSNLAIEPELNIFQDKESNSDIVIFTKQESIEFKQKKVELLQKASGHRKVRVVKINSVEQSNKRFEQLDITQALEWLNKEYEIKQVLVEAGARINGYCLESAIVDKLVMYKSSAILGDGAVIDNTKQLSRPMANLTSPYGLQDSISFKLEAIDKFDDDIKITYCKL